MIPKRVGKYTILGKVGRGATSVVYRAYDPFLDRFVAIKIVSQSHDAADEVRKRFHREAQAAAQLNHPNIVTIFDSGEDQGKLFIAMELLEGTDLRQLIRSKKELILAQKLDLTEQILDGLAYAHSKGLVHRDLKPGNIHIQSNGRAKIMDFGTARFVSSEATQSGSIIGTPGYMSPEQTLGQQVDASSDVFSFGTVFYELIASRQPFRADSIPAIMYKIVHGEKEPLKRFAPDLHPQLIYMVDKAHSPRPKDRYRDAGELLTVLRAYRQVLEETEVPSGPSVLDGLKLDDSSVRKNALRTVKSAGKSVGVPAPCRQITGALASMKLERLLEWCATDSKTGTLRLHRGPIEKRFFFKEGRLFSSTTNSPRETLGHYLISTGKITETQLSRALVRQDQTGEPLGRILVGDGVLEEPRLQELLLLKSKESLYDCFLWKDAEFCFDDDQAPEENPFSFSLELDGAIDEGKLRRERWERIREVFPSRHTTLKIDEEAVAAEDEISEEDQRILDLVGRGKNLAEIALELHAVEFYVASRLLELHEGKLVQVEEAPEELPYEQQVEELRNILRDGLAHFNAGEYEEALSCFRAALEIDPQSKAYLYVNKIERIKQDAKSVGEIPLDGVPLHRVSIAELSQRELSPEEGFVFSRINGEWDVNSIQKICPFAAQDVLIIIKQFLDDALIELK